MTSLYTYDFSTFYTTLPHNLIKEKLFDLIKWTFYKKEGNVYDACNDKKVFSLLQTIKEDITFGLVRMYVTPYRFSWTIFILDLALSYRQIVGVTTDTKCAPLIAGLFLSCYEINFLNEISNDNQADIIKAFNVSIYEPNLST